MNNQKGMSMVEILVGLVLLAVICITTLNYFAYGLSGLNNQGNRRAALERARERLEQLMAADVDDLPPFDGQEYWCSAGNPCTTWTQSNAPIAQTITVNGHPDRQSQTSVQAVDDPSAGTGATNLDTWEFSVQVWFSPDLTSDDHHRVYLRTLRTP